MSDIKAMIRAAKLPEKTIEVCLRGDLVAEYEAAESERDKAVQARGNSLDAGTQVRELDERLDALSEEMAEATVPFRLRAMPRPAFRALIDEYPPRKDGETGEPLIADRAIGVNPDFFSALVKACTVAPELDAEDWRILLGDDEEERRRREVKGEPVEDGKLTDRQFDNLADAAWALNRRDVDVPFSPGASRIRSSEPA